MVEIVVRSAGNVEFLLLDGHEIPQKYGGGYLWKHIGLFRDGFNHRREIFPWPYITNTTYNIEFMAFSSI